MSHSRPLRRTALALAVGLAGAALPVVLAGSASAADACLSEAPTGGNLGVGQTRCDDVTPPETTLGALTPAPNAAGYTNATTISIAFAGSYTDGDTDPISYECQFFNTAATPTAWTACSSPFSADNLTDSKAVAYTFRVRAIDSADSAIDATSSPGLLGSGADTDLPDVDQSPAQVQFRVDTTTPNTYIFGAPYDAMNPDNPMVYTDSPTFRLAATEAGVTYACAVDGTTMPCREGLSTFPSLAPGDRTLTVTGTDIAGNVDPTPSSIRFAVPANLSATGAKWQTFRDASYVGGDFITTSTFGAKTTLQGDNFREVRLLCTTGPRAGRVEVTMPSGKTYPISLKRKTTTKHDQIIVRDQYAPLQTGTITVRVVTARKPIVLDGLLVH